MADYSQGPIAGAPPAQPGYNNANTTMSSNPDNAFLSKVKPPYRPWLGFLPPVILAFTVGVIAMVGYAAWALNDGSQSIGFNLFTGVWTLLVGTYLVLAFWVLPNIHYRWIIFILSVLSCIWWLTAFAYLASNTRDTFRAIDLLDPYSSYTNTNPYSFDPSDYGFRKRDLDAIKSLGKRQSTSTLLYYIRRLPTLKKAAGTMAGASAIGAIIWVTFCVFTVFYGISLFSGPPSSAPAPMAPAVGAPEQKIETYAHVQPTYPPPVAAENNTGFAPVRPDSTFSATPTYNTVDPRDPRQAPGAEFLTPPPPGGYPNQQFGQYEADRNYTVSPLSINEMPASQPPNLAEMPTAPR
ncbi:hypothetical protein TWF281_005878 [Arthrobotrys megalospora]